MTHWLFGKKLAMVANIIVCFAFFGQSVQAATLTNVQDIMTRQLVSTASNHEIRFVTPTGVDAAVDTITIMFANGFNLTGIDAADILLTHGPTTGFETNETLAASAAAGVWGVGVSGQIVTFTAPTFAVPGEIVAGDLVIVRIGTAAGAGADRIVNPGGANMYPVHIGGGFGDVGAYIIPISSGDSLLVSVTVPSPSSPSPRPCTETGTCPPPPPAPRPCEETGTCPPPPSRPCEETGTCPPPPSRPCEETGTCPPPPSRPCEETGTCPPPPGIGGITFVIRNLRVVSVDDRSALVTWNTDFAAVSIVEYGVSDYARRVTDNALLRTHSIRLTGLTSNTSYQLRAVSRVPRGVSAFDTTTFRTTRDVTPPSNPMALHAVGQDRQIALEWTNPVVEDFSDVVVVVRDDRFPTNAMDGRLVYVGSLNATIDAGLSADREYFYAVFARDRSGNASTGAIASARTWAIATVPETVATSTIPLSSSTSSRSRLSTRRPVTHTLYPDWRDGSDSFVFVAMEGDVFQSFPRQSVRVSIPSRIDGYAVTRTELRLGEAYYQLAPDGTGHWSTVVDLPDGGLVQAEIDADLENGTVAGADAAFVIIPRSVVRGKSNGAPLAGVEVRVLQQRGADFVLWDPRTTGQTNPFTTGQDGAYGFFVEPGTYRVLFRGNGLLSFEKSVTVRGNLLGESVTLEMTSTLDQLAMTATQLLNDARELLASSNVQMANERVVAPVVVIAAMANLATATSMANLFHYLYFLFTQPLLLIGRRKRKQWGVVYNALTKQPIDLVVVRLIDMGTGRVTQTRITDVQGRYSFFVKPGLYRMQVVKAGFIFPTHYLSKEREDGAYLDLYHGEPIEVVHAAMLTANVPMDPLDKVDVPLTRLIRARRLRLVQRIVSSVGVVASLASFAISPGKFTGGMLIVQVLTYAIFYRLAMAGHPKGWGMVYDGNSRRSLGQTVVRIFDKRFHKLLETQVTSKDGKYAFFTGPNIYKLTAEKTGYEKFQSGDIDLTKGEERVVKEDIRLKKV